LPLRENKKIKAVAGLVDKFVDYFRKAAQKNLILELVNLHSFLLHVTNPSFSRGNKSKINLRNPARIESRRAIDSESFPQFQVNGR
jgi:hypothetical protein